MCGRTSLRRAAIPAPDPGAIIAVDNFLFSRSQAPAWECRYHPKLCLASLGRLDDIANLIRYIPQAGAWRTRLVPKQELGNQPFMGLRPTQDHETGGTGFPSCAWTPGGGCPTLSDQYSGPVFKCSRAKCERRDALRFPALQISGSWGIVDYRVPSAMRVFLQ
jgi:hypothetical protein